MRTWTNGCGKESNTAYFFAQACVRMWNHGVSRRETQRGLHRLV